MGCMRRRRGVSELAGWSRDPGSGSPAASTRRQHPHHEKRNEGNEEDPGSVTTVEIREDSLWVETGARQVGALIEGTDASFDGCPDVVPAVPRTALFQVAEASPECRWHNRRS